MFPTLASIKEQIKERNYAEIPHHISHETITDAANKFLTFLTLPQELKSKLYYQFDENDRGAHVGYVRRLQDKGNLDDKEFFHFHDLVEKRFGEYLKHGIPEWKNFFESGKLLFTQVVNVFSDVLKTFEVEHTGIWERFFVPQNNVRHFHLRFLKYDSKQKGDFLAKGHYDRGGCTLAIAESAPGLRVGKTDKDLKEVEHKRGSMLFMPALHFQDVTSSEFSPAWHDVVQRVEDRVNNEVSRWAIVFFADAQGMKAPTVEEAHTPKEY